MTTEPQIEDLDSPEPTDDEVVEDRNIRYLRRKAQRADELGSELDAARRENAFLRAGVDLDSPLGAIFARGYDGELDVEAIKAAYQALAASEPSAEPPELAITAEREALASGAVGDTGETPQLPVRGPDGRAVRTFRQALEDGAPRDEAMGYAFATLVEAAMDGDESVIVPWRGREP